MPKKNIILSFMRTLITGVSRKQNDGNKVGNLTEK